MDRRDFLRRGIGKVTEVAVEQAEKKVTAKVNWIRPPFALPELEFLLACTRCSDCIDACPHNTIFPLAARLGPDVVATPALDLLNSACHLCDDWPCVQSCKSNALQYPDTEQADFPKLALASIDTEACLPYLGPECGACSDSCPVEDALVWDNEKPVIQQAYCTGCALCREACILEPKAINIGLLPQRTASENQTG